MNWIKNIPAWACRKVIYFGGALIVAVLGAFGVLSEVQVDQWTEQIDKIITYAIGVSGLVFAGAKTGPGSDSSSTNADVERASRGSITAEDIAALRGLSPTETAREVIRMIRAEEKGELVLEEDTAPAASVADYYKGQQ